MPTYHVSPSGSNGDGLSWAAAKTSYFALHAAISLSPGDVVIGDDATFRETVAFKSGVTYRARTPAVPAPLAGVTTPSLTTISGADDYSGGAVYKWVATGEGTNEYALQLLSGAAPGISQPGAVYLDDVRLRVGTKGSLADHQWAWGPLPPALDQSSSQQLNGTTGWNHTLGVGSGANRLLVAAIKIEDSSFVVSNVTYNGQAGTKRVEKNDAGANREHLQIWEWLDAALPSGAGTYAFAVTYTGGTPQGFAHARSYTRVAQSAPITTSGEAAAASTVSASLTGTSAGALILSAVGTGEAHDWDPDNAALSGVHAVTGTTVDQSLDVATDLIGAGGTIDVSWHKVAATTSNRIVTVAAAYAAASSTIILRDDSGDPDTTGALIEGAQRFYCISDEDVNDLNGTVFDGMNVEKAKHHGYRLWDITADVVVKNALVRLCEVAGISVRNTNGANWVDGFTVQSCEVAWIGETGIRVLDHVRDWLIERCDVHHNSQSLTVHFTGGIYVQPTDSLQIYGGVIRYNRVHHNGRDLAGNDLPHTVQTAGRGIWIDTVGDNSGADPILVYGNYSYENRSIGLYCENAVGSHWYNNISKGNGNFATSGVQEAGLQISSSDTAWPANGNICEHNLLLENVVNLRCMGDFGDVSAESIVDNIARNNVTSNGALWEAQFIGGATNDVSGTKSSTGHGNVWWPNAFGVDKSNLIQIETGAFVFSDQTYAQLRTFFGLATGDTIEGDPQVADADGEDWRVRLSSPVRDRGASTALTEDFFGNVRPQGQAADAGVYELPPALAAGATGLGV